MDELEVKEGFYKLNSSSAAERVREGDGGGRWGRVCHKWL